MRRIERRMTVRRSQSLAEYFGYVNTHPEESRALFDDILINVTEFFRDEEIVKVSVEV
jgi:two-component system CheB/CheR fusion protein